MCSTNSQNIQFPSPLPHFLSLWFVSSADAYSCLLTCLVALSLWTCLILICGSPVDTEILFSGETFYPKTSPPSPFRDAASRQRLRILKRSAVKLIYMKLPFWESKSVKYQQLHTSQLMLSTIATRQACSSCSPAAYLSYLDSASRFFSLLERGAGFGDFPNVLWARQCI